MLLRIISPDVCIPPATWGRVEKIKGYQIKKRISESATYTRWVLYLYKSLVNRTRYSCAETVADSRSKSNQDHLESTTTLLTVVPEAELRSMHFFL